MSANVLFSQRELRTVTADARILPVYDAAIGQSLIPVVPIDVGSLDDQCIDFSANVQQEILPRDSFARLPEETDREELVCFRLQPIDDVSEWRRYGERPLYSQNIRKRP